MPPQSSAGAQPPCGADENSRPFRPQEGPKAPADQPTRALPPVPASKIHAQNKLVDPLSLLGPEWILIVATILLCVLLLTICHGEPPARPNPPTATHPPSLEREAGKTLVVCLGQEPDSLYLYGSLMLASSHIRQAVYDGPIDNRTFSYQPIILEKLPSLADGDAAIEPVWIKEGDRVSNSAGDLVVLTPGTTIRPSGCRAAACEITYAGGLVEMDRMSVTFRLKAGILWQDGEPLRASDSVYSFRLSMDPDSPVSACYAGEHTASYKALDEQKVVWTGLPGYLDATYFGNFWSPLPEHAWGHMSAADVAASQAASRFPLSYGPFKIVEWVSGSHITAVKNPHYFRADEGLPYLDRVTFRFLDERSNTAIGALLAGECDILTQDVHLDEQVDLLMELEGAGELGTVFVAGTVWEHVDFGIKPVESYDRPNFFQDVRTRRAIAMCLDTQSVIDALFHGRSIPLSSYIPPSHPLYTPDVVVWDYDPQAARALLEQVGWQDRDGDGVREAHGVDGIPDGSRLAFKWRSTTAEPRVAYMQIYQQNLLECGIELSIENLPVGDFFADGPEGAIWGRRFDLASFAWLTGVEPPCSLYLSSQIPSQENKWVGQNHTGFSDPEYDAACKAAMRSLPGTPEYQQYHHQAQRIFAQKLPAIPLFSRLKLGVYAPHVKGFIVDSTQNSEMWNIEAFDVRR